MLLAFALLLAGYLLGTIERPTRAQTTFYGNDGTFGSMYSPYGSNGPSYYYDNHGHSGSIYPNPYAAPPVFSGPKQPC